MVRVVSPDRVVYTILNEAAISSLVDELYPGRDRSWRNHLVGNLKQLCGFQNVGDGRAPRAAAENWKLLDDVVWIRLDGSDEYVPLVGTVTHMFESVMQLREDFINTKEALRELMPSRLAGKKGCKFHSRLVSAQGHSGAWSARQARCNFWLMDQV